MGNLILFGSAIGFGIALVILLLIFLLADIYENGFAATGAVIAFIGVNYFWGNFAWLSTFSWYNVGAYLFIGFLFSIIRTYFKGKEFNILNKSVVISNSDIWVNKYGYCKDSFKLKEHVTRWIFLWPFSLITWAFSRIFIDVWNAIYSKINRMYEWLFNL